MTRDIWETKVRSIKTDEDIKRAFNVVKQLRTHQTEDIYLNTVKEMMEKQNYHMFGLYDPLNDWKLLSVIGFAPTLTLYYGNIVWVHDLVTDYDERGNRYGEHLLAFVEEEWAEKYGYDTVALTSGFEKKRAHHFYTDHMNYDKVSYLFKKNLR